MALLRKNIVANVCGHGSTGFFMLVMEPIYLHYLGAESYGLVGFLLSVQALLPLLDTGLSVTTNREIARHHAQKSPLQKSVNIVRTFEFVYLAISLLLVFASYLFSPWIASSWLKADLLDPTVVRDAIYIFSVALALRLPIALYIGVLRGLERQVLYNTLLVAANIVKSVGALAVLVFVSADVITFLSWYLFATVFELSLMAFWAWRSLRAGDRHTRGRFDKQTLFTVGKFALSVGLISASAVLLKQLDKLAISNILSLKYLGYYTIATTASRGVYLFCTPIFQAVFPRFSNLYSLKEMKKLEEVYHQSTQLVALVVSPLTATLMFFSYDVLFVWTQSAEVAEQAHQALSILAFAAMLNTTMQIPYALQLASGLTKIPLINNTLATILLSPLIVLLVSKYGITGGAAAWAIFNTVYYTVIPAVTHRYVLKGCLKKWVMKDTLPFMIMSVLIFGGFSSWRGNYDHWFAPLVFLSVSFFSYTVLCYVFNKPLLSRIFSFRTKG